MVKKFFFAVSFFCLGVLLILVVFTKWPGLFKTEVRYVEVPVQPPAETSSKPVDVSDDITEFEAGRIEEFNSGNCAHLQTAYGQDPEIINKMLAERGFELVVGDAGTSGDEVRLDHTCRTKAGDTFHLLSVVSSSIEKDFISPFSVILGYKESAESWKFFPVTTITNGLTACHITNLAEKPQATDVTYVVVSCYGGDAGVSVRDVFVWDKERLEVKQLFSCMTESTPVFYPEQAELPVYLDDIQQERCTMK